MSNQQQPPSPYVVPRSSVLRPRPAPLAPQWPSWPATVWPLRRRSAAAPRVLLAAAAAGVVAAVTFRLGVIGIGYPITAVALLVAGVGLCGAPPSRAQLVMAIGASALFGVATFRSAGWLVALCVLLGLIVGSLSLVRVRTWAGLALGSVALATVSVRTLRWAFRGLARLRVGGASPARAAMVVVVTSMLMLAFGGLFVSADPAYANALNSVVPYRDTSAVFGRVVVFVFFTTGALAAAYTARRPPLFDVLAPAPAAPLRRWEWAAPLVALDVLFASFVAVQLAVLFGGRRHVLSTAGLTYAQYARQGFWQLLAVTTLTLALVAVAIRKAARASKSDKTIVRVLLGTLCLLALIVVASAVHRMSLYEQQFGYTRLRVFVYAVELWLGAVLALVLLAGIRLSGAWLPRAVLASAVAGMLTLAAVNPDALIAERNVARYDGTRHIDLNYLATLSADAVPALDRLPAALRSCALRNLAPAAQARRTDPWYDFNLGRANARDVLAHRPVGQCATTSTGDGE